MSIVANCGYASAIATDCVGVRQRWVREFDRHGRELSVTHCLGDGTPMLLCRRGYDSLGRISEESAGDGASEALVNEYAYDIRSRAVAVSSGRYSQRLDFTPGGNVSRMDWCADASCEPWHSYRFGYDALSRVVSAEYSDDDGRRGIYDTTYDYDLNGNVTALSRRGVVSSGIGGEKYGLIDCLAYSYEGNRVVSITEDGQEVYSYGAFHFVDGADEAEEYTYDSNGNITSDHNRGISDISYDVNNRPHRIRFSEGGETRYIYGLDGVKRRAEHVIPGIPPVVSIGAAVSGATVTSTTDYSGAFVYEDGVLERIHLDCGYLSYRDFSGRRLTEPEYHFYQRDHLGNNRVDLCSDGSVSQITHYYPFGLPMSMGYSPESQRWKFGNKELDRINGLDLYDFEARAYDPATIRFYRPDDLAHNYHPISPYVYCANNPLINIDKDGKDITILIASEGAKERGHMAAVIQNGKGNYFYISAGANDANAGFTMLLNFSLIGEMDVKPLENVTDMATAIETAKVIDTNNSIYDGYITFKTSETMDENIYKVATDKAAAFANGTEKYRLYTNNCADIIEDVFEKGTGVDLPTGLSPNPNSNFENIVENKTKIQDDLNNKK